MFYFKIGTMSEREREKQNEKKMKKRMSSNKPRYIITYSAYKCLTN